MHDAQLSCVVVSALFERDNRMEDIGVAGGEGAAFLTPGMPVAYKCPLGRFIGYAGFGKPQRVTVQISMRFRTLLWQREYTSAPLNWDAQSGTWSEGKLLN